MKLLFITLNFHPDRLGNSPIITDLAAALAGLGHTVQVVCALPHHETGSIDPEYRGQLWQTEVVRGVQVLRVWIATGERFYHKLANYASFTGIATLAGGLLPRPDLIFSPSPPITLGLVDALLGRWKKVPFVFNLQDIFPDVAVQLGVIRRPEVVELFRLVESFTYRQAAALAVVSPGMAENLVRKGVPRDRITVIPNCVDVDVIRPTDRSLLREQLGLQEQFVVGFSGRIGYSQGLEHVLEAAARLTDDPRIAFLIIGNGSDLPGLQQQARRLRLPRITFLPTQPREALGDALAAADLHLVPLRRGLASYSVPSKLLGVMAAARPALASLDPDSDAAALVREADCGTVVPPEDPTALAQAIRAYADDPARGRREGLAGRAHLVARFHPRVMAEQYEALFRRVAAAGRTH